MRQVSDRRWSGPGSAYRYDVVAGVLSLRTSIKPSVLVIDDDQDIREFLADFLHFEGFEVTTLADPSFAVARIRDEVFHLIMLDVMMPKICGLDLLPEIRAVNRNIPVIMMTSSPSLDNVSSALPHGIAGYIWHPLTVPELREAIRRATRNKGFMARREEALHAVIGMQIRNLRKARHLTLKQLARRTNLLVSQLSQIELGVATPSVSDLSRVAAALHVPVTALFAGY
jgi:two-component system OmpR family response regulator